MTEHQSNDVVGLLTQQHEDVRRLFSVVDKSTGKARSEAFDRLRYLLAVHETAEEEIVHPFARRTIKNGAQVVEARLEEENQAKQILQELEKIGTDSVGFMPMFAEFQKAVEAHAEHEEHDEFPQIAREATPAQLRGMEAAVKAAEAIAPTHPHPGVESPVKNLIAGPFAAVMDRTRDAIRKAMG